MTFPGVPTTDPNHPGRLCSRHIPTLTDTGIASATPSADRASARRARGMSPGRLRSMYSED